jgi:CRP-like cAMP-binding protein
MQTVAFHQTIADGSSTGEPVAAVGVREPLADSPGFLGVTMPFEKGEEVYGEGEKAECVYRVLGGAVRTYNILKDGRRQIGGFYLPGDLFGLEADERYSMSAEAVVNSNILVIRRKSVMAAAQRDPRILSMLLGATSRELNRARDHALLLVKTAQERVAAFLLEMASRLPGESVELPMCRQDIADYLGLTIETVSRTLTQLGNLRTIEIPSSRRIVLKNPKALAQLNS